MTAAPMLHLRKTMLAALIVGVLGPQFAMADEARERALEARVAELEKIVNQLVEQSKAAPAPAPRPVAKGTKPIQDNTLTPGSAYDNTTFPTDSSQYIINVGAFDKTFQPLGYNSTTTVVSNSKQRRSRNLRS